MSARPNPRYPAACAQRQKGVAALVVVMVLFFIVSLVAAYASRTLIFDQRTSANQYRSTAALEAAEAGLEWTLGLLNSGRIDDSCVGGAAGPNQSFRDRYVSIDAATGVVTPKTRTDLADAELWPSCTFNGTDWTCSCPADGEPTIGTTGPAFRVRFKSIGSADPGLVRVEVRGCTTAESSCLAFNAVANDRCGGTVCIVASLFPALRAVPTAAATARGAFDVGGAALTAANSSESGSGITIHTGGAINPTNLSLVGRAGTPGSATLVEADTAMADAAFTSDRMFAAVFGVWPDTYRQQPALVEVDCTGTCDSTRVLNEIAANPGRPLWLNGSVVFNGGTPIGSATSPVVLVATGNVQFSSPITVYGLVYNHAATWTTAGNGTVRGAIASSGSIGGNATMSVVRDGDVLTRLRYTQGSFVRVPGSWRDFP